jgi:endonuclease/exonuclease/phosphatase family metal-dependent hydrolase
LHALRGQGLRRELLSGRLFRGEASDELQDSSELRGLRIAGVRMAAEKEAVPVVIAGDFNLPGQSFLFRRYLSSYQDGFEEAGRGFGYTFPTRFPWMRLDRILAGEHLRFGAFETGCGRTSDHHCVVAELTSP